MLTSLFSFSLLTHTNRCACQCPLMSMRKSSASSQPTATTVPSGLCVAHVYAVPNVNITPYFSCVCIKKNTNRIMDLHKKDFLCLSSSQVFIGCTLCPSLGSRLYHSVHFTWSRDGKLGDTFIAGLCHTNAHVCTHRSLKTRTLDVASSPIIFSPSNREGWLGDEVGRRVIQRLHILNTRSCSQKTRAA